MNPPIMVNDYSDPYRDTVKFASDVLDMHNEIMRLRAQVEGLKYYREEYFKLTGRLMADSDKLVGVVGDCILSAIGSLPGNQENSES